MRENVNNIKKKKLLTYSADEVSYACTNSNEGCASTSSGERVYRRAP